jgi:hypothetical protein
MLVSIYNSVFLLLYSMIAYNFSSLESIIERLRETCFVDLKYQNNSVCKVQCF